MTDFVDELDRRIFERRKTTSPLYQTILAGRATERLLAAFVLNRWPVKSMWTRNILGIAARVEDHRLRLALVENIYEEESGALSGSKRHLETFADFGAAVGVTARDLAQHEPVSRTRALVEHNVRLCNSDDVHFTAGVAGVLLLMEGQPPIVTGQGTSMLAVMRDVYKLPESALEFFVHHASSDATADAVSDLEDEHAAVARELLRRHCTTDQLQADALAALERSLDLRHRHFDMILDSAYAATEKPFSYAQGSARVGA